MKRKQSPSWNAVCNSSFLIWQLWPDVSQSSPYKLLDLIPKSMGFNCSDFFLWGRFVENVQKISTNLSFVSLLRAVAATALSAAGSRL